MNIAQPDLRTLQGRLSQDTYEHALKMLDDNPFPEKSLRSLLCAAIATTIRLYEGIAFPVDCGVKVAPFSLELHRLSPEGFSVGVFVGVAFEVVSETKVARVSQYSLLTPGAEFDFWLSLMTEIETVLAKGDLFDTLAGQWALAAQPAANFRAV